MIIADENLDSRIVQAIRSIPKDVYSIAENLRGISDEEVIAIAQKSGRIIITRDKDYADWVFAYQTKNISVILVRYNISFVDNIITQLLDLLKNHESELYGKFITITDTRVRIREI